MVPPLPGGSLVPQPPPSRLMSKLSATRGGGGSGGPRGGGGGESPLADPRRGRLGGLGPRSVVAVAVTGSAFGTAGSEGEAAATAIQRVVRGHWARQDVRQWFQDMYEYAVQQEQEQAAGGGGGGGEIQAYGDGMAGVGGSEQGYADQSAYGEQGGAVDGGASDGGAGGAGEGEGATWTWEDYASYSEQLREEGAACMARGELDAAADWLSQALEYNQDNGEALASRCACYLRLKEFSLALADARVLSEWSGQEFRGVVLQGSALLGIGDAEGAERSFLAAQKLQPKSRMVHDGLRAAREVLSITRITEEQAGREDGEGEEDDERGDQGQEDDGGDLDEHGSGPGYVLSRPWLQGPEDETVAAGGAKRIKRAGSATTSASERSSAAGEESEWSSLASEWQDTSDATASEAEDTDYSHLAATHAHSVDARGDAAGIAARDQGAHAVHEDDDDEQVEAPSPLGEHVPLGEVPIATGRVSRLASKASATAAPASSKEEEGDLAPVPSRGETPLRHMSLDQAVVTCQASLRRAAYSRITQLWTRWHSYGGCWEEGMLLGGELTRKVGVLQAAARRRIVSSMYGANAGSRLWVARAASRQGGRHLSLNDMLRQSILSDGGVFIAPPGSTRTKTPGQKAKEVAESFITSLASSSFLSLQSTLTRPMAATAADAASRGMQATGATTTTTTTTITTMRPAGVGAPALTGLAATLSLSWLAPPRSRSTSGSIAPLLGTLNSRWLASRSREAIQSHVGVRPGTNTMLTLKGAYVRRQERVHRLGRPSTPRRADVDTGAMRVHLAQCSLAPAPTLDTRRGGVPLTATCSTTPSVEPCKPRSKAKRVPDAALQVAAATRLEAQFRMSLAHIRFHALMAALVSEHFGALRIQDFWRAIEARPFARVVHETVMVNARRVAAAILIQRRIARGPQARAQFAKMLRWKRLRLTEEQIAIEKLAWARKLYMSRGHRARFAAPAQKMQAAVRRCLLDRKYHRYMARRRAMTEQELLWDDMRLQSAMEHNYWRQMRPGDWRGGGNKKRTRPEMLHHNRGALAHWWYDFQEDDKDESVAKMQDLPARMLTRLAIDQAPNHPDASLSHSPPRSPNQLGSPGNTTVVPSPVRPIHQDKNASVSKSVHQEGAGAAGAGATAGGAAGGRVTGGAGRRKQRKPGGIKGGRVLGRGGGGAGAGAEAGAGAKAPTAPRRRDTTETREGRMLRASGLSGSITERSSMYDVSASGWTERSSLGSVTDRSGVEKSRMRRRRAAVEAVSNTGQGVEGGVMVWTGGVGPSQIGATSSKKGSERAGLKFGLEWQQQGSKGGARSKTEREKKVEESIRGRREQDERYMYIHGRPQYVSKIPKLPYITSPNVQRGGLSFDSEVIVQGNTPRETLRVKRQVTPEGVEESFGVYTQEYQPSTNYLEVSREDESWGFAEKTAGLQFGNGALRSAARSIALELREGARREYHGSDDEYEYF